MMGIRFAEMEIAIDGNGSVAITQFIMCEDPAVITLPTHQAKAVCAAIMAIAEERDEH